eukprot:scaffold306481_cov22-Tisochrysis_lutea.AAC.1
MIPMGQSSDSPHLANERIRRTNLIKGKVGPIRFSSHTRQSLLCSVYCSTNELNRAILGSKCATERLVLGHLRQSVLEHAQICISYRLNLSTQTLARAHPTPQCLVHTCTKMHLIKKQGRENHAFTHTPLS